MIQSFFIAGRLPGMNEIIKAAKSGRGKVNAYARQKAEFTAVCANAAIRSGIRPVDCCDVKLRWHEPARRRDPDNLCAATKFVLDGLVSACVLRNDGWDDVLSLSHSWLVTDGVSGVMVTIESEDE